jgi:hypothetical protein
MLQVEQRCLYYKDPNTPLQRIRVWVQETNGSWSATVASAMEA